MDSKELIDLGKTDATRALVIGNSVFEPLTFSPDIIRFTRKQYQFLNSYRLGVPLEEAAKKVDMTTEQAERFLDKPQTVAWLRDRSLMHHIKTEWEEPGKWWAMGNEVLEGTRKFDRAQTVVFQEFGQRAVPKSEFTSSTKIEINIDPGTVKSAFQRQDSIETQLVEDSKK